MNHETPACFDFGRRLRLLRRIKGIKQSALAHELGVDQATVSRWESGQQYPAPVLRDRAIGLLSAVRSVDSGIRRLVENSRLAVHLIDDHTHECVAASPSRFAEWKKGKAEVIGQSLWRYATPEILLAERRLADHGWWEQASPQFPSFMTSGKTTDGFTIRSGLLEWQRIYLADGSPMRLCTSLP